MMYLGGVKRGREGELESITTMANCLMLLSRGSEFDSATYSPDRVFECKTCDRKFPSFQALGGHRASHKRPRTMGGDLARQILPQPKPKSHECPICGLEFAVGQALGGHMRRHRAAGLIGNQPTDQTIWPPSQQVPVVKKSNSRRVLCLDLNLSPRENGLDFQLEKVAPVLQCYF